MHDCDATTGYRVDELMMGAVDTEKVEAVALEALDYLAAVSEHFRRPFD
jgi:hypothetical protein